MKASADELAPPKLAATPPPFPACRRTAAISTRLSMMRRIRRKVYIRWGRERGHGATRP
jgi:hypothetical protein